MADIGLTSQTKLKTGSIFANGICLLKDKKGPKVFIAHAAGLHIYEPASDKFEDVNLAPDSSVSCLSTSDDLVFFCSAMKIMAVTGNGKIVFEMDTFLAVDRIDAVHVYGYRLWLVANNMICQFRIGGGQLSNQESRLTLSASDKTEDVHSQLFQVRINHSILVKKPAEKPFLVLLKSNNQVSIFDKKQQCQLDTESPPSYACSYKENVLVGTASGEVICLRVQLKKISQIWRIANYSHGRVNCLLEVSNGFLVCRDRFIELWNGEREQFGAQEVTEKITSAYYSPEEEKILYGTLNGSVVAMFNYEKMMLLAKERDSAKEKADLVKKIAELRAIKVGLATKLGELSSSKNVCFKAGRVSHTVQLDYARLCYCIDIVSEHKINRINAKGQAELVGVGNYVSFQSVQKGRNVYVLRVQQANNYSLHVRFEERCHECEKLQLVVFTSNQGALSGTAITVELKHLSQHHKVDSKQFGKTANVLVVTGDFKYFQMNIWLNSVFNDFGPASQQNEVPVCYESIVTKAKLAVTYRDSHCEVRAQSPTPLLVIKKVMALKAKEKHLSLNMDVKTDLEVIATLLAKMSPQITDLVSIRKQHQLLPGLIELSSTSLSTQLQAILARSEEIKTKFMQQTRLYSQSITVLKQMYASYRLLNGLQVSSAQTEAIERDIIVFDVTKMMAALEAG